MEDPLTIPGPPPSYALESDSEESDWGDESPALTTKSARPVPKEVTVTFEGRVEKGRECVFLVGEAGEWIAKGVKNEGREVVAKVLVDGEQVASVEQSTSSSSPTLIFLSSSISLVSLSPVSSTLLSSLLPKSTTIINSYHLPTYIPSSSDNPRSADILCLSSNSDFSKLDKSSLQPFTPPNLLHGLASSLFTISSLPSSSSNPTPTLLLLLPTTTLPPPLNGPFPLYSTPNTSYDAGGPTDLSEFGSSYKALEGKFEELGKERGWSWWIGKQEGHSKGAKEFEWLEKSRAKKRREQSGSMYM